MFETIILCLFMIIYDDITFKYFIKLRFNTFSEIFIHTVIQIFILLTISIFRKKIIEKKE